MNFELFVARNIIFNSDRSKKEASSARPIVRIAIAGVSLSMVVMILALAIVQGFQREIRNKVIGFGSHIQITNYDKNFSLEGSPIEKDQPFLENIKALPEVKHIQTFAIKAGILKTNDEIEGIALKGVGKDFNWEFFKEKITSGNTLSLNDTAKSNGILISQYTAKRLNLKTGDQVSLYFIQDPPRVRKLKVEGVYDTGMEELDKLYALCDIQHIQKLNDWETTQVSGFEVQLHDFEQLKTAGDKVYKTTGYNFNARTIKDIYPQIFDWLQLQDINVVIIIVLMTAVAGINMISALLILIMERTTTIGILQSLGCTNLSVRKIFIYIALYLSFTGMLIGNLIGIGFCLLQKHFGLISLSQESYYVSKVPIHLDLLSMFILNGGTLVICFLMLLIPSLIITKISPLKAIRFN